MDGYYCTHCGNYYDEAEHLESCDSYKLKQFQQENQLLKKQLADWKRSEAMARKTIIDFNKVYEKYEDALKLIANSTGLVEGYMKKIAKEALKEQTK